MTVYIIIRTLATGPPFLAKIVCIIFKFLRYAKLV